MPHRLDHVARAPLFDRLSDFDGAPRERHPYRTLTYGELLGSVRREIQTLLSTRVSYTLAELAERERTVLDYGAGDLSWVSPLSSEDQHTLESHLSDTVAAFEPRLREVWIKVDRYDPLQGAMFLTLSALLIIDDLTESISFPLAVSAAGHGVKTDGI